MRLDINQDASDEADHVKVVLKDVSIRDCRVNGPRVELVVKDTIHDSILKAQLESGTIRASHVQGGALFLKSARGNIYVDDASQDSWDLNWRAGSNQACFETFGTGARDALSIDYSGRTVDGVWTPKQVWRSNSTTGSWWLCGNRVGRPTPSTRRRPRNSLCSMAWRFTKVVDFHTTGWWDGLQPPGPLVEDADFWGVRRRYRWENHEGRI